MVGIDVGHQFFSRAEMVVVGFHQHWLNGIDYIGQTGGAACKSGRDLVNFLSNLVSHISLHFFYIINK